MPLSRPPAVLSVNLGWPREVPYADVGHTSIGKAPHLGPVAVAALGLDGDQISDSKRHGGVDQAVYAFAREDLDAWAEELGREIPNGLFGENLTTRGLDVNNSEIGERWRIGSALFEVRSVRIPCRTFQGWLGESGFDSTAWIKRFTAAARPGPYLRVLEEGHITAGDPIEIVDRPGHGVRVSMMFRALTTDRRLLPRLLAVEDLVEKARIKAEAYAAGGHNRPFVRHN